MLQDILLILAGIYLAWSLGANDATNVISTAVGSKTISFRKAMVFFVVCLGGGVFFLSKNVIKTVSSGIVDTELITISHATIALFTAALWVHFATWKKLPVSISQSVVSAVFGIGLVEGLQNSENLVHWATMLKLVGVWLFSPIFGFLAGWILFKIVHGFVRHRHLYFKDTLRDLAIHPIRTLDEWWTGALKKREKFFGFLLLLSSGYMAVALGANTIGSTTGLIYSGFSGQGDILGFPVTDIQGLLFIKSLVLVAVVLGIVTFGKNLVDFMGRRLVELNPLRGFVIQLAAASVVIVSALMGYPLSTTGVFIGAFLGEDSGEDHPRMKARAVRSLKYAFVVTIPVTAALSGLLTWVLL